MKNCAPEAARPYWWVGYFVCVAGFLLCVISYYPGYLSPDSIRQLQEARAWSFTDWHPPLMAAVWSLFDLIIPGPFGMLLLHNAVFWSGLALLWRATYGRSVWVGLCLVGLGFVPTALALLSTVWKDVGLGAALLCAAALLYTARRTNSRAALLASVPLLFYGYGVRQNAAAAVLPLALWSGFIALRLFRTAQGKAHWFARRVMPFVVGLAYFLLLTAAVLTTTRMLTGGRSSYIAQVVLLYDLAAISQERGEALFPDYLKRSENFSLESATLYYTPRSAVPLFRGEGTGVRLTENPDEYMALREKWLEVVPANRSIYLRHHWETFKWVSGWGKDEVCNPYLATSHSFGVYEVNNRPVHRLLRAVFWKIRNTLFFRGYFWLLASLALLGLALAGRLRGDLEFVFVLSLSGLLYGAGYFFYMLDCDFRFFWWTALSSLVGLCFTASSAIERWRSRGANAAEA